MHDVPADGVMQRILCIQTRPPTAADFSQTLVQAESVSSSSGRGPKLEPPVGAPPRSSIPLPYFPRLPAQGLPLPLLLPPPPPPKALVPPPAPVPLVHDDDSSVAVRPRSNLCRRLRNEADALKFLFHNPSESCCLYDLLDGHFCGRIFSNPEDNNRHP
ncbi:hypothetical protein B0H63DRAFT_285189 [Podospora didyma]|uniref:Uncharacterized protein n=1 Tax=Podospora didyma TaxID=330526 RepID=A0AAE0N6I5_9PEZI|nr:hypothetical protein B0H63DRAFT_285189 [Podospora didyma]